MIKALATISIGTVSTLALLGCSVDRNEALEEITIANENAAAESRLWLHWESEDSYYLFRYSSSARAWLVDANGDHVEADKISVQLIHRGCDFPWPEETAYNTSDVSVSLSYNGFPAACNASVSARACATKLPLFSEWCI